MAGPTIPNQALLNGINPLAYMGVRPSSPALYLIETRDPTTTDKNYALGTWWMNNNAPYNLWRLANLNAGVALWIMVNASPGALLSLTSNAGGPVFPLTGNINVVGDGVTIVGVGNPGTHTITLSAVGTGTVETLTGNSGGAVGPLAGNINVVGDGTTINVTGNPGTHTLTISAIGTGVMETLTGNAGGAVSPLAGNINTIGDTTNNITITGNPGTHTLTAAVTGTTIHTVQLGNAAGSLSSLTNGTTGQILTAVTGADPQWTSPAATKAAFSALQSSNVLSVTGDGTFYQVIFDTELLDATGSYNNGTGVFTAPAAGNYYFYTSIGIGGIGAGQTDFQVGFVTSLALGSLIVVRISPFAAQATGSFLTFGGSAFLQLAMGDTIHVAVIVSGGAKSVGVQGENTPNPPTAFYGFML